MELAAAVARAGSAPPSAPRPEPDFDPRTEATAASRKARFDARPQAALAPSLSERRTRALQAARAGGARLSMLTHERHTTWEKSTAFDELVLEVRFFGTDAENDRRMLALLRALDLPGVGQSLPDEEMQVGDVVWRLGRHPLIAPPGEAREIRYTLTETRDPVPPAAAEPCRKPKALELPSLTPGWLRPVLGPGSTRRLVSVRERRSAEPSEVVLRAHLLFHNGEAADEFTGKLADAATAAGFFREAGAESNRQVFRGQNSERLSMKPTTEDLSLGCRIQGPVTVIELVMPKK